MEQRVKRVRRNDRGFIGVNLAKSGDMTLFNKVEDTVNNDPEMDRSKLVRIALKEYFEKRKK